MKVLAAIAVAAVSLGAGVGGWILGDARSAPPDVSVHGPMAWIDNPHDGDAYPTGRHVANTHAAAQDGIVQMVFTVNSDLQAKALEGGTIENVDWSFDVDEPGEYTLTVWGVTAGGEETPSSSVVIIVFDPDALIATEVVSGPEPEPEPEPGPCRPSAPSISHPDDGGIPAEEGGPGSAPLVWSQQGSCDAEEWRVEVAIDSGFTDFLEKTSLSGEVTSHYVYGLSCETWYWRIRGVRDGTTGPWAVRSFTVVDC